MHEGYELFYSAGGHCGPYYVLADAIASARARLNGRKAERYVEIKERSATAIGGYGKTILRLYQTDSDPQPTQQLY